jgi:hypothetical protein
VSDDNNTNPLIDRATEAYIRTDNPPTGEVLKLIEALSKRMITTDTPKPAGKPQWDIDNR